jgi:putative tricarboxylic transport membrane protein
MNICTLGATALALLAALAAVPTWNLGIWDSAIPGAGLFPLIVALLLFLTSVGSIAFDTLSMNEAEAVNTRRLSSYAVALIAFALLLEPMGASFSIAAIFLFLLRGVERFSWRLAGLLSACAVLGTWVLFEQVLNVPLPHGLQWWTTWMY